MKDIYVDLKKASIFGESRDAQNLKSIEVSSYHHIVKQPKSATSSSAGGHTSERVEFGDLVFTKDIDSATPFLMHASCMGTIISDIEIRFYRAYGGTSVGSTGGGGANTRVMYYKLLLKNSIISSVSTAIGSEGLPVETFTIKPAVMQWAYTPHKIDGTSEGVLTKQWSLVTNTPVYA
jgi:type VI secretion system secreted protein Hcp